MFRKIFICAMVALLGLFPSIALAKRNPDAIQVLATFDAPGASDTIPIGINEYSEIVGYYFAPLPIGFIRYPYGRFDTFIAPGFTLAGGINNFRVVTGTFYRLSGGSSGYIKTGNIFSTFDLSPMGVPSLLTMLGGNNDAGNFVGSVDIDTADRAFVHIQGTPMLVNIPGELRSSSLDINNQNVAVGLYSTFSDPPLSFHGFIRNPNGTLVFPFDYAGASATSLNGINDQGWMVGGYRDGLGKHGFFFRPPNTFVSFDYPGAVETSMNGINNQGYIVGDYTDANGIQHGFLAVVTRYPLR